MNHRDIKTIRHKSEVPKPTNHDTLCEDEGCPHFGTKHVCVDVRQMLEQALSQNQQLKADLEYHQQREKEFIEQVNALITVRDRQKVEIAELRKEIGVLKDMTVSDGFGSTWAPCETHGCRLQVMRPGDARCPERETDRFIAELKESVETYRLAHEQEFEEIKSIRAQVAALQKPVTDEEWKKIGYWERHGKNVEHWAKREGVDALIQSRLKDRQ